MRKLLLPILIVAGLSACTDNASTEVTENSKIILKKHSVNDALIKSLPGFESLQIFPLISSDDQLAGSPNFVFGPQPDGAGIFKNPTGVGYVMLNNHEIAFSVSRVFLDETFKPTRGEYIVDAAGGNMRLCSATLATPQEHGFGPLFLTAGETNGESMIHGVDPNDCRNRHGQR
jgi:hypothetical protein